MRILPVLLLFLICNILCHVVDATIKVDNRTFSSSPDKYIGLHMKSGVDYSARLQRIPGDQHLCGGDQSNVTVPNDGLPSTWDNEERGEINERIYQYSYHPSSPYLILSSSSLFSISSFSI